LLQYYTHVYHVTAVIYSRKLFVELATGHKTPCHWDERLGAQNRVSSVLRIQIWRMTQIWNEKKAKTCWAVFEKTCWSVFFSCSKWNSSKGTHRNKVNLTVVLIRLGQNHRYRKAKIDCLSFVVCPLLAQPIIAFFSAFFAVAVYSTKRQAVRAVKQSIILRCLWPEPTNLMQFSLKCKHRFIEKKGCYQLQIN